MLEDCDCHAISFEYPRTVARWRDILESDAGDLVEDAKKEDGEEEHVGAASRRVGLGESGCQMSIVRASRRVLWRFKAVVYKFLIQYTYLNHDCHSVKWFIQHRSKV